MNMSTKIPISSRLFGEAAYWITTIGFIIAVIGLVIYLSTGSGVFNPECVKRILQGESAMKLWEECSPFKAIPQGHWYLGYLTTGDGIAMLGIAICAIADLIAILIAAFSILVKREISPLFGICALIIAIIIALAVSGVLVIHH